MTWAMNQRYAFIARRLEKAGQLKRQDLVDKFGISHGQASVDIRDYMAAHPGAMVYDRSLKRYVRPAEEKQCSAN